MSNPMMLLYSIGLLGGLSATIIATLRVIFFGNNDNAAKTIYLQAIVFLLIAIATKG